MPTARPGPALYCTKCLALTSTPSATTCPTCGSPLAPLFDPRGALTSAFLKARGFCCENGCLNCPYKPRRNSPAKG